ARFDRDAARVTSAVLVSRLGQSGERLRALTARGDRASSARLERLTARLAQSSRLLDTLSHRSVLERGFALVLDADGRLVKRASALSSGDEIAVRFADGDVGAVATGCDAPKRKPAAPDTQGDLF
ncbi:MAG: hypothetical protein JJ945_16000, partial [Muricauda sp.]